MKLIRILLLAIICLFALTLNRSSKAQFTTFTINCDGSNDTTRFTGAISVIGSNVGMINARGRATPCVLNTLTVPANVIINFDGWPGIFVNSGQTLTILSDTSRYPKSKIFYNALASQGTVTFAGNTKINSFYPQWWGALGDNSANDVEEFRAAIAAINGHSGGTLEITDATYKIQVGDPASDTNLTLATTGRYTIFHINSPNIRFRLSPKAVLRVITTYITQGSASSDPGTTPYVSLLYGASANCSGFQLEGGKITWEAGSPAVLLEGPISYNHWSFMDGYLVHSTFANITIDGFPEGGLTNGYTDSGNTLCDNLWENVQITNYGGGGHDNWIYSQGRTTIRGGSIISTRTWQSHGFYTGADRPFTVIEGVYFKGMKTAGGKYAIHLYGSSGAAVSDIKIAHCTFDDVYNAILLAHSTLNQRISITDNTFSGRYLLTGTVAVTNGSPTVTGTGTAFLLEIPAGNTISIAGVAYTVSSVASNTSLTLTANYAGGTTSGLTTYLSTVGVSIGTTSKDIKIQGNVFRNLTAAIVAGNTNNLSVTGNTAREVNQFFNFVTGSGLVLNDNTIGPGAGDVDAMIKLQAVSSGTVSGNTLTDWATTASGNRYGIYLAGSVTGVAITGNVLRQSASTHAAMAFFSTTGNSSYKFNGNFIQLLSGGRVFYMVANGADVEIQNNHFETSGTNEGIPGDFSDYVSNSGPTSVNGNVFRGLTELTLNGALTHFINNALFSSTVTAGQQAGVVRAFNNDFNGLHDTVAITAAAFGTYTPHGALFRTIKITMDSALTLAAPTVAQTGDELTFIMTQDATGARVLTLNATYKANWTPDTTANKVNSISFRYNGTAWIQTAAGGSVSAPLSLTLSGDVNNYASITAGIFTVEVTSSGAARNITGIVAGVNGERHLIINVSANDVVLQHQNASSTAANRIITNTGADLALPQYQSAVIYYSTSQSRWIVEY